MRIISKFHDYYDRILGLGQDLTTIYLRERREISVSSAALVARQPAALQELIGLVRTAPRASYSDFSALPNLYIDPFAVLLAGRLITGFRLGAPAGRGRVQATAAFSEKAVREFLLSHRLPGHDREEYDRTPRKFDSYLRKSHIEAFLGSRLAGADDCHRAVNAPLLVVTRHPGEGLVVVVNPRLEDFCLAKVVDPASCFQEISAYLSGVLGSQAPETAVVSDASMRDKKGFDERSFKTASPGRKARRRAGKTP